MTDNEISKERLAKIASTGEFTYYGWPQKLVVEEAVKMARELQRIRYGMPADALASRHQEPVNEPSDWERMARAQSRKLQAVLHVPGVKDALRELDWENGDPLAGWEFIRRAAAIPKVEPVGYVRPETLAKLREGDAGPIVGVAAYDTTIPLYASPQPSPVVTDEMVERVAAKLRSTVFPGETATNLARELLAAALTKQEGSATLSDEFECPINQPGCTKNCGSYGCGN